MSTPILTSDALLALETTSSTFPYVTGVVNVDIDDMLLGDHETFLDDISIKLVGSPLLTDITYRAADVADDRTVRIEVTGDASIILDELNEQEQ